MYISRVVIDYENRRKTRDLMHLGAYHNWVEHSFPEEISQGVRSRKLWRIDRLDGEFVLLIISEVKPDISKLERYGVPGTGMTKDYTMFLNSIEQGMKARFKITLNPVVSMPIEGARRGRVVPLVNIEDQMKFLKDRSVKHGFYVDDNDFQITERSFEPLKKNNGRDLRISRVTYEGNLIVQDIDKFRDLLINGMGQKKAYGFGLMTIIPVKEDV